MWRANQFFYPATTWTFHTWTTEENKNDVNGAISACTNLSSTDVSTTKLTELDVTWNKKAKDDGGFSSGKSNFKFIVRSACKHIIYIVEERMYIELHICQLH